MYVLMMFTVMTDICGRRQTHTQASGQVLALGERRHGDGHESENTAFRYTGVDHLLSRYSSFAMITIVLRYGLRSFVLDANICVHFEFLVLESVKVKCSEVMFHSEALLQTASQVPSQRGSTTNGAKLIHCDTGPCHTLKFLPTVTVPSDTSYV